MDTDKSVQGIVQEYTGSNGLGMEGKGTGMEVRVAILEERTKRMDEDFKALTREVQEGFENMQKLMSRNPVTDFVSEHWKTLLIFAAMLLGQPAADILKMLEPLIKGVQ